MKAWGIVFIVLGAFNLLIGIVGVASGYGEAAGRNIGAGLMIGVLGAFLVSRARKKAEEAEEKEKWEKGE